ncbi:MAG: hypothetical protein BGO98_30065 [Myxococcales bacterium 68-20]|nr:MAG: hypothetical protein BGO98_30065 [Myxococcales bacterium 68-20]
MPTVIRMRASFVAGLAVSSVLLLGCPVGHQSPPARAQEAATELNLNTRFGRMELAAEHVAPAAREAFLTRRKAWGSDIRVADYELAGLKMNGDADAETFVKVAWYRVDQGDLRVTTLKQKWRDFKGTWQLVDESRAGGDAGLIGDATPSEPAKGPRNAQFPTIRLGGQQAPEQPAPEVPTTTAETAGSDAPASPAATSAPK